MIATGRGRWTATLVAGLLLAAGLVFLGERPAAAASDWMPDITVTGKAVCNGWYGETDVAWKVVESVSPEGYTYGGPATFEATPASTLYPNTTFLAAPIQVNQVIQHGSGATKATLIATVDLSVPGGNQIITVTGSVALPPCPAHARASVAFAMNCDQSVDVTVTYPPSGEALTSATLVATSSTGATWTTGAISLQPGGDVHTVQVAAAYNADIVVYQPDASPSQSNSVIGHSGQLVPSSSCPGMPGGYPPYPIIQWTGPPVAVSPTGAAPVASSNRGGTPSSGGGTSAPGSGVSSPSSMATPSQPTAVDLNADDLGPNALTGGGQRDDGLPLSMVAGLGSAGIIAAAAGLLVLRRRRDPHSADEG